MWASSFKKIISCAHNTRIITRRGIIVIMTSINCTIDLGTVIKNTNLIHCTFIPMSVYSHYLLREQLTYFEEHFAPHFFAS